MGKKRIGIIGIRGYKMIYSGFETFVYQLIKRANLSLYFFLYSRRGYQKRTITGKNFYSASIPTIPHKYLETFFYCFFSTIHSLFKSFNSVLYLGVANTPFIWLQKLRKRKVIVNVDGLDWERKRWSLVGKFYLKACERISAFFADALIADSREVLKYYKDHYNSQNITFIPYGAEVQKTKPGKILEKFKIEKDNYILFTGRLVPENSPEELILAFKNLDKKYKKGGLKCVILGGTYHEPNYENYIKKLARNTRGVVMTDFLKREHYDEVLANALVYVETKSTGGTHPSLLEAMAFGNTIIAKKLKVHEEVLKNCALYYDPKDSVKTLTKILVKVLKNPKKFNNLGKKAKVIQKKNYSWDSVINKYEKLFQEN